MSDSGKYYITTAIPYVNADPHIGHALEFIQADVLARHQRQRGRDVFFLTGADENSLKNVQAAEKEGLATRELVDRNTRRFTELAAALDVSNTDFIRTVEPRHFAGAARLWAAGAPGDIYRKTYRGLYCVGCEQFYTEDELEDGLCPEHKARPEVVEEENYFFRLSTYQEQLEELIAGDTYRIIPESRKNEVLAFIRAGLADFSISRSRARARNWGVPVPGDPGQVMYVWYDALSNYITGLDYADEGERFRRCWPADLHVIGKGIIRFHAVYWPAMLLSAGLPLPRALFVHGYVTAAGEKMSKSLGNVIDPFALIDRFGVEPLRYYLVRYVHPFQDSDVTLQAIERAYTADLANGIGNLVSRTLTMIERRGGGIRPTPAVDSQEQTLRDRLLDCIPAYERLMSDCDLAQALARAWSIQAALDRHINDRRPWHLAKDPAQAERLDSVLYTLAEGLRLLATLVYPVLPRTGGEIWRRLGLQGDPLEVGWAEQRSWGLLTEGLQVTKGAPLFPRIEKGAESTSP